MVALPEMALPTVERIYQHYSDNRGDWRRDHLGASQIGKECRRALWYSFRWATAPKFGGRMLRLFETGTQQESRIVQNLRDAGVEVYDIDPETGSQFHFEEYGGHYAGSMDAVGIGFQESKQWHVIEIKTSGLKSFAQLQKSGVEKAKPEHYAQMQQYMAWSEIKRAYYLCVCKDTDAIYGERIAFSPEVAKMLSEKARTIIFSDVPPERIGEKKDDFRCRFCDHRDTCWGILPEVNCRTCAMATPEENGTWTCARDGSVICKAKQREALGCHVFIPDLVPLEQIDADPEQGVVEYEGLVDSIVNGPGFILSTKLQEVINDPS